MEQTWYDKLTFDAVGAAYGDAQASEGAPTRGNHTRIIARRDGDGTGTVTLEVAEDVDFEQTVAEIDFDLSGGDGDTDVWGGEYTAPFRSRLGPYYRVKDTADNADSIMISMVGEQHHGA